MNKSTEILTWSEIKIRKPDEAICKQVNLIMENYNASSASKALEIYIKQFTSNQEKVNRLQTENNELKHQLNEVKDQLSTQVDKLKVVKDNYERFQESISNL
ncbi:MAG: hypothetical protein WBP45_14915 [Daejeonella sp.]